jgi:hypothetical protein
MHAQNSDKLGSSISSVIILKVKELRKNTLRAFVDIASRQTGFEIYECVFHIKGDKAWVSPPSKAMIGRDGNTLRDSDGKVRYSSVVSFSSKAARDRWSDAVVAALQSAHPELFH